mmetsp:Transcript_54763/g.159751  ORF Transcript_54763/g.159751 Transcript_54763/m.159751 type:complete len:236 (+) Transcript_54763:723-1430(+)
MRLTACWTWVSKTTSPPSRAECCRIGKSCSSPRPGARRSNSLLRDFAEAAPSRSGSPTGRARTPPAPSRTRRSTARARRSPNRSLWLIVMGKIIGIARVSRSESYWRIICKRCWSSHQTTRFWCLCPRSSLRMTSAHGYGRMASAPTRCTGAGPRAAASGCSTSSGKGSCDCLSAPTCSAAGSTSPASLTWSSMRWVRSRITSTGLGGQRVAEMAEVMPWSSSSIGRARPRSQQS